MNILSAVPLLLAVPFVQEAEPAASDEIVVTGVRESTLDLDRLRRGQETFAKHRAAFAPNASLYYQLRPRDGGSVEGMTLTLRSATQEIAVPIDAQYRFIIPSLPKGDWELLHNRGRDRIAVRAMVLSPGTDEGNRRLGDLRLQCRVGWVLMRGETSFLVRGMFDAIGGCGSKRVQTFFRTTRPINTATIDRGGTPTPLTVREERTSYHAPLYDGSLPNDARVRLTWR